MTICQECDSNGKCWAREKAKIYGISEYGFISGEDAMIKEIINRGPIVCNIAVTDELHAYDGGIFKDYSGR